MNFPKVVRIEPASNCNLACSHCPTGTVEIPREIMSAVTQNNVISNVRRLKDKIQILVLYHGGEPLLNKNFVSMVHELKDINSNFFIKTVSNGMALTEEISKGIIESGLDSIEFSLDGLSASESAYVRVKSRPELTIKNVMRLIELKKEMNSESPKIFISTTQFVRKSELDNIPDSAKAPLWLQDVFSDFVEYKPTFAVKWPHMGDSGKFELHQINDLDKGYCDHVVNTITVRADGSVVACCYDLTSKLVMGNINFDLLENIWNNSNYDNLRTSIKEKSYISICNTCSTVRPVTYLIPKWETNSLQ